MNHTELLGIYDDERRRLDSPDARREVVEPVVRHIGRFGTESQILFSDLGSADVREVIDREVTYFRSIGHDLEWKTFSHDQPTDLVERLVDAGFATGQPETVLVAPTAAILAGSDPGIDVRRLTDPVALDDFHAVSLGVWGGEPSQRIVETLRVAPESLGVYVAYLDGRPVGSSRCSFDARSVFTGLWGGAVLAEYRGRGVYRAMVRRRAAEALAFGAPYLQVDALVTSRPILERLGFRRLTTTIPCTWRMPD